MAKRSRDTGTETRRDRAEIEALVTSLTSLDTARSEQETGTGRRRGAAKRQRLAGTETGSGGQHTAESGARARRDRHGRFRDPDSLTLGEGIRSLAHRNRRQLYPWYAMLGLLAAAGIVAPLRWLTGVETLIGATTSAVTVAGLGALGIALLRWRSQPYWTLWLLLCGTGASVWLSSVAFAGLSYTHLVVLYAATLLLGLGWWQHVRHPCPTGPADVEGIELHGGERAAQLLEDWETNAGCVNGPAPGANLTRLEPYEYGYTGEVRLVRGKQALSDIQAALPRLSTALDVPQEYLIVEAHPAGPPSRLRAQIVTRSPVTSPVFFDQPICRDGRILLGPYADGISQAMFVLYTEDSMESGYVLGSKGSGKSRILETIALTAIARTPTVVFYVDGQNGASSPLLWEHALWHAGPDDAQTMLNSLLSIKEFRQLYNRKHKLTGFTPSVELPGILVIIDECHKTFTERTTASWADLAREGRKLGIGILAASQVTTLDAFGSGQQADALRSSLVASNGLALRTASKVQSNVFPGLSVDLMSLPKLPGFGYTVDDGDERHRTAPFRNRYLISDKQAAQHETPLPQGIHTAEEWFDHEAPKQQLDEPTAQAAGHAFADRHATAAREQAELDTLFERATSAQQAEQPHHGAAGAATPASTTNAAVIPFPQLSPPVPFTEMVDGTADREQGDHRP